MKSNKNNIEISEKEIHEKENLVEVVSEAENKPEKPKKVLTQSQLEALAKARIKAQERKQELADDRARDFSRRSGHLSGGADALAAVAETVAVPGGRRLGHPSRRVAGRPGQERPETPAGRGTDARRGTDAWRRGY